MLEANGGSQASPSLASSAFISATLRGPKDTLLTFSSYTTTVSSQIPRSILPSLDYLLPLSSHNHLLQPCCFFFHSSVRSSRLSIILLLRVECSFSSPFLRSWVRRSGGGV